LKVDVDQQVAELIACYPDLRSVPIGGEEILRSISGVLHFEATAEDGKNRIVESFQVEISVPVDFPASPPTVKETGGRIPENFHRFPNNQILCLGSPLRLKIELKRMPTLLGFVEACLIPYFYGYARFKHDGQMPFGELAHGRRGLLDEYRLLFDVSDDCACVQMLEMLSLKKRLANKRLCPCRSGKRFGRCHQRRLSPFREVASRSWFKREHEALNIKT
jgi:hypothetical protein